MVIWIMRLCSTAMRLSSTKVNVSNRTTSYLQLRKKGDDRRHNGGVLHGMYGVRTIGTTVSSLKTSHWRKLVMSTEVASDLANEVCLVADSKVRGKSDVHTVSKFSWV